jgi:glycosyltransferase involved in cell wall biosynthesis
MSEQAEDANSIAEQLLSDSQGRETEEISGAYFAQGSAATHEHGVLYQGDYQNESDGTSVAIRLHARALAEAGVPVLLKPFSGLVMTGKGVYEPLHVAGVPDTVREEIGALTTTSVSKLYPAIRHFVVHKPEDISNRVMRGATGGLDDPETLMKLRKATYGATVLYSVWERDRISDAMVREMNRMGDNWVPCEQNAEMLVSCGVERVAVIPHPYDVSSQLVKLTKRKPMKTKRFYHIGRWEPRKNSTEILRAFFAAFRPGDDVHLTMKFHGSWEGYENINQVLEEITESFPEWSREKIYKHMTPIEGHLRADQIVKLHFENNIYLAPSCGEAWCLPAFEAKVAGNAVIHTPYGGTADFCDDNDVALDYTMEDVPLTYGWPAGSRWGAPDIVQLVNVMQDCVAPSEYNRSLDFANKFSMVAVGQLMRKRLVQMFGEQPAGEHLK